MTPPVRSVGRAFGPSTGWRAAQAGGLIALAGLLAGAWLWPERSLPLFWNVVLPLLPASFLVTPALWRGVCPLATLNMVANRPGGRRLDGRLVPWAGAAGMMLLGLIVPARKFLLQTDGTAFAVLVGGVSLLALVLGAVFQTKAGFCNSLCPVLPVERLYGQRPLMDSGNPRCGDCDLCTPRGCLDLTVTKAVPQTLGPTRRTTGWLNTAFGAFAAGFPGFVYGFGTSAQVEVSQAGLIYLYVGMCTAVSYLTARLVVRAGKFRAEQALPVLAAAAAGAYYWFAAPGTAETLALGRSGMWMLRGVALGFVAWWLVGGRRAVGGR
jgi:nitrite reductase (NADH) large subunit